METRQKNILTILLIVIIVIIAGIVGYLGFEVVNQNVKEKEASEITAEFDNLVPTLTEGEIIEENADLNQEIVYDSDLNLSSGGGEGGGNTNGGTARKRSRSSGGTSSSVSKVNVNGNWIAGTISIPATGIKYSIFAEESKQNLEKGVCMLYSMEGLNHVGNTVIVGHNYRNRLFFSRNKNLKIGDKIIIKDCTGLEITYSIFNKFTANKDDASFYQRDTKGKREITLSTCTDQGTKTGERLIICAREV